MNLSGGARNGLQLLTEAAEMAQWLEVLVEPGQVVELRALQVTTPRHRWAHVERGYFEHGCLHQMAYQAARLSPNAKGVYFTINPLNPALHARCGNRVDVAGSGDSTSDSEILRRRWLLIDLDPVRPRDISSTDIEHDEAERAIRAVAESLTERGWPAPVVADSGNGFHLLYRVDLPTADDGLVKRVLQAVAQLWNTSTLKVDEAVFNPARIVRVYGTMARKGDSTTDRPHRRSRVLEIPAELRPVPQELLAAMAAEIRATVSVPLGSGKKFSSRLNVARWLADRGIAFRQKADADSLGRIIFVLDRCPFDPSHRDPDSCVMQSPDGRLSARCFHNSCSGHSWRDFKMRIGTPDPCHWDPPLRRDRPARRNPESGSSAPNATRCGNAGILTIVVSTEEHKTNEEAAAAIADDDSLFQRAGRLVYVLPGSPMEVAQHGIVRPAKSPRIVEAPHAIIRDRLTTVAEFIVVKGDGDGESNPEEKSIHPPSWCVQAVAARGDWPGVRHLEGIVDHPIFRPDGSILCMPGYDSQTRLILSENGTIPAISEQPTREEVDAALTILFDLVIDFPIASEIHMAAFIAALLTPLARFAFQGPCPLNLFDSNVRGAGKGLLADIIALICTGRAMPVMSAPNDDEEARKRITAIAIAADPLILIDNIAGNFGSASLDAALTSTMWKDRLLGRSETIEIPLRTVWYATGNNVQLQADTARRICHIRLESREENPEDREGFRHADLRHYVRTHRKELLKASLTVLRGWAADGRPDMKLKPWGSYEGWSDVVRNALVWAGLADPGETRIELREQSDTETQALAAIMSVIRILGSSSGITVPALLKQVQDCYLLDQHRPDAEVLIAGRDAILAVCPGSRGSELPSARSVGNKLKHLRGRIIDGQCLEALPDRTGLQKWRVKHVDATPSHGATPAPPSIMKPTSLFEDT